jgi:hypothetical protein
MLELPKSTESVASTLQCKGKCAYKQKSGRPCAFKAGVLPRKAKRKSICLNRVVRGAGPAKKQLCFAVCAVSVKFQQGVF